MTKRRRLIKRRRRDPALHNELKAGCPRCGGAWVKRSGLVVCKACGHQRGSQDLTAGMEYNAAFGGLQAAARNRDDQEDRERHSMMHPRGRRDQPLTLKGKGR